MTTIKERIEELEKLNKELSHFRETTNPWTDKQYVEVQIKTLKFAQEYIEKREHTHQINLECAREGTKDQVLEEVAKVIEKWEKEVNKEVDYTPCCSHGDKCNSNPVFGIITWIDNVAKLKQKLGIEHG